MSKKIHVEMTVKAKGFPKGLRAMRQIAIAYGGLPNWPKPLELIDWQSGMVRAGFVYEVEIHGRTMICTDWGLSGKVRIYNCDGSEQ